MDERYDTIFEEEPKEDRSVREESARTAFNTLTGALDETEKDRTIDLSKPSKEPWAPELRGLVDQKETLEMAVEVLKADIDYLDPVLRKQADDMILRAELYLSAS